MTSGFFFFFFLLGVCVSGCRQSYSRAVDRSSTIIGTALLQQQRWASGGTGKEKGWKLKQRPFSSVEKAVKDKKPVDVVYEGAMADTLRRVKVLSITTCCLSVAGTEASTILDR